MTAHEGLVTDVFSRKIALRAALLCPAGLSGRTERGVKELKPIGLWIIVLLTMLLGLVPASAAPIDDQFQAWLQNDLWPEAKARGISKKTFDAAFIGVKPNLKLPDLVMPGEKPTPPEKQQSRIQTTRLEGIAWIQPASSARGIPVVAIAAGSAS